MTETRKTSVKKRPKKDQRAVSLVNPKPHIEIEDNGNGYGPEPTKSNAK